VHAFPKDAILANPSVDAATIVSNLEAFALNCLDQMQVLEAVYLAQYDVAHGNSAGVVGTTVHSCPDSILPAMELPRGRN